MTEQPIDDAVKTSNRNLKRRRETHQGAIAETSGGLQRWYANMPARRQPLLV